MKPQLFKKTDIDFLMRTLVIALLIMAILHAFKPYMTESEAAIPTRAEIENLVNQSKLISPTQVGDYLRNSQRPTMVVIYASWCSYCKKLMPEVFELWKESKIPGDQMLLISLDTQATELAKYLLVTDMNTMLGIPVMLKKDNTTLPDVLHKFGAEYEGGIPYIGFFGPGGKVRDEVIGLVDKDEIEPSLKYLK